MTSSPSRRASLAPRCRLRRAARASSSAHFAVRRAVFVDEQALFAGDDRDALRRRPRHAARGRLRRRRASPARCGCTRSTAPGCGRATGWPCCPSARAQRARRGSSCASPSRPRASAAGARWSRTSSCPTCASSSTSAGSVDGAQVAVPRRHRTSRWRSPLSSPQAGERLGAPGPTPAPRRRRAASRSTRESSKRAARRAGQAAARERLARRLGVLGRARRARSRSSGTSRSQRSSADAGRARERVERRASRRSRRPRASAAASRRRRASRRRARRGRGRVRRPRRAPRRRRAAARGRGRAASVKNGGACRRVPALEAERGEQHVAGPRGARRAAARVATPVQDADSAGGRAERQVPADDGDAEPLGRPRDPVEHASRRARGRGSRACRRAPSGRPPIARTSETLVTTAAAPARERVGRERTRRRSPRRRGPGTRRRAGRAPRRRRRCAAARPLDERELALGAQAGRGADRSASASRSAIGGHWTADGA